MGLQGVRSKNKLILRLMEQLVYPSPAAYRDKLIRFSQLNHTNYSEVYIYIYIYKISLVFICYQFNFLKSVLTFLQEEDFFFELFPPYVIY